MPSSISDTIIGYISYIQQKQYITIERFRSIRRYFFQSIGFFILLYYVFQLPILFYLFLKFLFSCIIQIFSIIFWLPLKTIELVLPKTDNYNVMFPLFWFCSFSSFLIAKFFQKNLTKRHSFLLTFIILLLLQFLFIILPVATSIKEQRKLSSVPNDVERVIMKLSEMTGQREELTSSNNGIIKNFRARMNKLSTSIGNDIKVASDVEDGQNMNKGKKTLDLQIFSSDEKEELLLKQQANNLVDSSQQFSSKVLENSSEFIQEKKKSFIKSIIFAQKFHNWLNHVWNIFYQIQQFFSRSKLHLPQYNISSIYTAFTDLNCYDYTKSIHRYKQNYIYFLNTYRLQSPFPIYLSIIQSNGPKCYPYYPNSSCAIRSKSLFSHLKRQLFRFIRFWMIISIPITILLFIYNRFQYRQQYKPSNKLSNKTNDLPLQQVSSNNNNNNNDNNNHPLDKEIENKLHLWLEQEQNNGYQNISESYRIALNSTFSKQDVSKSRP